MRVRVSVWVTVRVRVRVGVRVRVRVTVKVRVRVRVSVRVGEKDLFVIQKDPVISTNHLRSSSKNIDSPTITTISKMGRTAFSSSNSQCTPNTRPRGCLT